MAAELLIHPTALVDPAAQLDPTVRVGAYSVIGPQVRIGAGTVIGPHCVITGDTVTGAYAEAHGVFDSLAAVGIDIADVTQVLEDEGVEKFIASWHDLKDTVAAALGSAPEIAR